MAPLLATLVLRDSHLNPLATSHEFKNQWINPGDVFSVLLILGGDVVARALAQLAGSGLTPVTFSFGMTSYLPFWGGLLAKPIRTGWVAYSVSALVSAVGENRLMPQDPDCKCKVINARSGHTRDNSSWIIGRIVRDFDSWSDVATKKKTAELLDKRWAEMKAENPDAQKPTKVGLVVTIYKPSGKRPPGVARRDFVYWSGLFVMLVQLGIAAIPCGLFGDWGVLMITVCGNALAVTTGLLPQWQKEKWACRRSSSDTYVLSRGNGAQHAIVILGNKQGLNLEDLASGQGNIDASTDILTRATLLILSTLWVLLLITAAGIQSNTWFLLAVGGIGIVQNVFVAGWSRRPENFGIPLDYVNVFGQKKVMDTLLDVEKSYPGLGQSMRDEFFPGKLHPEEVKMWERVQTDGGVKGLQS